MNIPDNSFIFQTSSDIDQIDTQYSSCMSVNSRISLVKIFDEDESVLFSEYWSAENTLYLSIFRNFYMK